MTSRTIEFEKIVTAIAEMCEQAAHDLPEDVAQGIRDAYEAEKSPLARSILQKLIHNYEIAARERLPICQDTGFAVYFVEMGNSCSLDRGSVTEAITQGTAIGYKEGYLRASIVNDPLFDRINTKDNTPPIIHVETVPGNHLRIMLLPKGGGCENMSYLAMLKPSDGIEGLIRFVVDSIVLSEGNPCPPTVVGIGIGGTSDKAMTLAKKAHFRRPLRAPNPDPRYAELEQRLLQEINNSGVGSMGLGGTVTALAVHIENFPCHIASLPVAVNLNCHAARFAEVTL